MERLQKERHNLSFLTDIHYNIAETDDSSLETFTISAVVAIN